MIKNLELEKIETASCEIVIITDQSFSYIAVVTAVMITPLNLADEDLTITMFSPFRRCPCYNDHM